MLVVLHAPMPSSPPLRSPFPPCPPRQTRCVQWLDELLPEDAAELCRGRVRLVVTEVPSLRLRYLEDFASKQDLIDANSELPGCCAPTRLVCTILQL